MIFISLMMSDVEYFFLALRIEESWGAWVAQSLKRPTSAQVTISWFMGSSTPPSGFAQTAQSLEPAWDSVSPSLSAIPLLMLCLSKITKH